MKKCAIAFFLEALFAMCVLAQPVKGADTNRVFSKLIYHGFSVDGGIGFRAGDMTVAGAEKLLTNHEPSYLPQRNKAVYVSEAGGLPPSANFGFSTSWFSAKHLAQKKHRYFTAGFTYEGGYYLECHLEDSIYPQGIKTYRDEYFSYNVKALGIYAGQEFFTRPSRFVSGSIGYSAGIVKTTSASIEHSYSEWVNPWTMNDTLKVFVDNSLSAHGFTALRINGHAAFWLRLCRRKEYFSRFYYGGGIFINADVAFSSKYAFNTSTTGMYFGLKFFFFD